MKKLITLFAFTILICYSAMAQMVLTYQIEANNTIIQIPLSGTVDVSVDWGDGTAIQFISSSIIPIHNFKTSGTFNVTITGTLTQFGDQNYFCENLISVQSWDNLGLTSLSYAFNGANKLVSVPSTLPVTVTDLSGMFSGAKSFNEPIGNWNTENVTFMRSMFAGAISFNQPIGNWNTTNVTDMSKMFFDAFSFPTSKTKDSIFE